MDTDFVFKHWTLTIADRVAHLTLDRPNEKNRIDDITLGELSVITKILKNTSDVWVIVLRANGDCFSAGVDVSLIGNLIGKDHETFSKNLKASQDILDEFEAIEKPIIASMHGYVIGGGLILSLCCDFRIAAENTIVCLPEVKRSIGVIMGTQRITKTIGPSHTKELVMLGDEISASRGHEMGLFHRVVTKELVEVEIDKWIQKILELPPLAVGLCKKIINDGQHLARNGQDLEIEAQSKLLDTADFREAISSFFDKRKPDYQGK